MQERLIFFEKAIKMTTNKCILWPFSESYGILTLNGKTSTVTRHALVATKGLPLKPNMLAMHSCHTPRCINPQHLNWGTYKENALDRKNNGTFPDGDRNANAKLSQSEVSFIRGSLDSAKVLSKRFNISISTIYSIRNRKSWV